MELFGMIVVLLVIIVLASDYVRRKKGLDYREPEKELPPMLGESPFYDAPGTPEGDLFWGTWTKRLWGDDEQHGQ